MYIKLYFSAPQLDLYSAGLSGGQDVPYQFYPREGRALFTFFSGRYPLSAALSGRDRHFSRIRPRQWLLESNQTIRRRGALLKRFVQSLQEAAPAGAEPNDIAPPPGRATLCDRLLPAGSIKSGGRIRIKTTARTWSRICRRS